MIEIRRTSSSDPDFIALVKLLDADLAERDGADHPFYAQFNKIDTLRHVVLACGETGPLGCGAIKEFGPQTMEIKRMYVAPESRNRGVGSMILSELEHWAKELSCTACVLETGKKQPEAIRLYSKNGYKIIPNYGQYAAVEKSVCFKKELA